MKRKFLTLGLLSLTLAACGNNEEPKQEEQKQEEQKKEEQKQEEEQKECTAGQFGANCDAVTCVHGTANEGRDGNGHCSDCNSDWSGIDCNRPKTCVNGTPNIGVNGNGACVADSCSDGFAGDNCNECKFAGKTLESNCQLCDQSQYFGLIGEPCTAYGQVTDAQGNKYKTTVIKGVTWMAENLRTIPSGDKALGTDYFYPNGQQANVAKFGLLYTWYTAKEICPEGWHLPLYTETDEETVDNFYNLGNYYKSELELNTNMAIISPEWGDGDTDEYNMLGLGILPAGLYNDNKKEYQNFNKSAVFWYNQQEPDKEQPIAVFSRFAWQKDDDEIVTMDYGFSVRCVKDEN